MAYATVQDLVDAFGETELIRLTTPEGVDLAGVVAPVAQRALDEASGVMDSYLRRRYLAPVRPVTPELRGCCCALARYALGFRGGTEPSEPVRLARKERMEWLASLADGRATLDGAAVAGPNSFAMVQDRPGLVGAGTGPGYRGEAGAGHVPGGTRW